MKKYINKTVAIVISFILCVVAVAWTVLSYNQWLANVKPPEPIVYGDFPKQPYWVFKSDNDIISTPATNDKVLFIKTSSSLYAVDILQKKTRWKVDSFTNQKLVLAPLVTGTSVVVVETGASLAAYSSDSGNLLWKTPAIENADTAAIFVETIAFNSQYLYVGRHNWHITAYDLKTGEVAWEHGLPGRTHSYVEANEDYVFVGAGETLVTYEATHGRKLWEKDDLGYSGPILLSGNTLYIADETYASLISLDINTHKTNWEKSYLGAIKTYYYSCASETEIYLLVAARKLMMVSKLDGKILWSTDDLGVLECPIVFKDKIYIRSSRTTLYSLDKETGRETGRMLVQMNSTTKRDFFRSPIIVNGFLAIPFGDNRLFIYQP